MPEITVVPPVVLFLDDGVHVFASVADAEQSVEAIDVRNHPEWQGFDSQFHDVRLDIFPYERKVLGFALKEEGIKLRVDPSMSIDATSDRIKGQMRDYLFGVNSEGNDKELSQLSAKDMLNQIFKKAADTNKK